MNASTRGVLAWAAKLAASGDATGAYLTLARYLECPTLASADAAAASASVRARGLTRYLREEREAAQLTERLRASIGEAANDTRATNDDNAATAEEAAK